MEKLSFLLFVFPLFSLFNNDHLVLSDNSVKYFEMRPSRGEGRTREQLENFLNKISLLDFRSISSTPVRFQCKMQMKEVLREARSLSLWALKMLDASAKLPSGILSGNLNQFGDFDECLNSKGFTNNQLIQGKYCLANIDIRTHGNYSDSRVTELNAAIHSNWILHNEFRDQGHRIPKFETFKMGICVPAVCSSEEIEGALSVRLNETFRNDYFQFNVAVDDEVCYVKEKNNFSVMELTVRFLFILIFSLTGLGTLVELNKIKIRRANIFRILCCFSLKKNLHLLLKTTSSPDDILCIHGARFLNAVALLLSHKQIAMLFSPFLNRTQMSQSFSKSWTMIGRSAILYTDSFILFSGLLASYSMVKDLDSKKTLNLKDKFISRIFRLVPNLFGVIFFCTYIMNTIGSGPQWGLVVSKYTDLCKKYMWRNFLFIHNYFGFENMCLTHTHQLGIDMQLFLMSPIFIYLVWKMPKIGSLVLAALSMGSTWLRYDKTHQERLSTLLYYGISVERLWKTANMSYILPSHRLSVYIMGILLGYYLRRGGRSIKLSRFQVTVAWILAISAGLLAIFGPYQAAFKEYQYTVDDAARFNAFAPILWTAFISWGLVACLNGYGGILNDFLSWKYFTIFTRISYAVYLTQFPIFFYYVGTERTAQYYKGFHSLFDVVELGLIFIASILLTLTFDIPFQELKKVLLSPGNFTDRIRSDNEVSENGARGSRKGGRKRLQSFGT